MRQSIATYLSSVKLFGDDFDGTFLESQALINSPEEISRDVSESPSAHSSAARCVALNPSAITRLRSARFGGVDHDRVVRPQFPQCDGCTEARQNHGAYCRYTLCVDSSKLVSELDMPLIVRILRRASSNVSRLSVPNSATMSHRPFVVCNARTSL